MLDELARQLAGAHTDALGSRRLFRAEHRQLGASPADIDHQKRALDAPAPGDPDDREECLLVVVDDVESQARSSLHLLRRRPGVRGPTERLRADHSDTLRAQTLCSSRVTDQRRHQTLDGRRSEVAVRGRRAQPEERRFVRQRSHAVLVDDRHEEVHRVRAAVDRGADSGLATRWTVSGALPHRLRATARASRTSGDGSPSDE